MLKKIISMCLFFCNMGQIVALAVLENYGRGHHENVMYPFAASCQFIGIYPFHESVRVEPRAAHGLNDISVRMYLKRILKDALMSLAIPVPLFHEMDKNLTDSFLEHDAWK